MGLVGKQGWRVEGGGGLELGIKKLGLGGRDGLSWGMGNGLRVVCVCGVVSVVWCVCVCLSGVGG